MNEDEKSQGVPDEWFKVCEPGSLIEGCRIHSVVEGRYITIFRQNQKLSAIDSVCYHASGPLTLGPLEDIEELGVTAVSCPVRVRVRVRVRIRVGSYCYQLSGAC
jgi:nitrite reductase/ring-hydroxylating ferredoxin subunit